MPSVRDVSEVSALLGTPSERCDALSDRTRQPVVDRMRFLDSQEVALAHGRDRLALKGNSDRQVVITKRNAGVSTKN